MALKDIPGREKAKSDVYYVLDENGNVTDTLRYPHGGSLQENAAANRAAGVENTVYKPNREDEEVYIPTYEAKASVSIDPTSGNINVTGPKWLTSDIINSATFKKNYSENAALLQYVNAYRQDKNAKVPDPIDSSQTISASDAIAKFEELANNYASSYAGIQASKDSVASMYGSKLNDEETYIANNFYDKDDYDKNGAVYIPKWALDVFDWSSLESWDNDKGTVSAQDFFENAYKFQLNDDKNFVSKQLQDLSKGILEGNMLINQQERSDQEEAEHQALVQDEGYRQEIARTIQMYNLVSQNNPEISAAWNATLTATSAMVSFRRAAENTGYNIVAAVKQPFDTLATKVGDLVTEVTGDSEAGRQAATSTTVINFMNPAYLSAFLGGELLNTTKYYGTGNVTGPDVGRFIDEITNDLKETLEVHGSELTDRQQAELNSAIDELNSVYGQSTGGWQTGQFIGNILWKITENIAVLNPVGGAVGNAVAGLGTTASGVGRYLASFGSPKTVAGIFKVLGGSVNVGTQAILETFFDDGALVRKAMASGQLTDEVWDKLAQNVIWNAIGEGTGWGASKGAAAFLNNTTPGRAISLAATKATSKVASVKYSGLHKFFTWLNRGDWQNAAGATVESGGKVASTSANLGKNVTSQYEVLAQANKTISEIPFLKELSPEQVKNLDAAYNIVFGERNVLKGIGTDEALESAAKSIDEASNAISKSTDEAGAGTGKSLSERINENYEAQRKAVALRINLENQFDAINKGVSIKMSEINQVSGRSYTDYTSARNTVGMLEAKNGSLTMRESGSLFSKESSEYLSYSSQLTRYQSKIAKAGKGGVDWKAAGFKSLSDYKAVVKYAGEIAEKLASLQKVLGAELTDALNDLLPKMARYGQAIDNYMISNGYYTRAQAEQIIKWRQGGDWGKNGERFIHTARLFGDEEIAAGVQRFAADLENPSIFATKMVADDAKYLKPGNIDDSFVDPNMVLYGRLRAAATVAQAQEMGRALHAISLPVRKLKGFDLNGKSEYEAQIITKSLKEMKKDFASAFYSKGNAPLADAVREAFGEGNLMQEGISDIRASRAAAGSQKGVAKLRSEARDINRRIERMLQQSKSAQNEIIDNATEAELSLMLSAVPGDVEIPVFDVRALSANTFDDWYASLPRSSQGFIKRSLDGQALNVTNVKKLALSNTDFSTALQRNFIESGQGAAVRATDEYQSIIRAHAEADLTAQQRTILEADQAKYAKIQEQIAKKQAEAAGVKFDPTDINAYGRDFVAQVKEVSESVISKMETSLAKNKTFRDLVKRMVDAGVDEVDASRYVVLHELNGLSSARFYSPLLSTEGTGLSAAQKAARKSGATVRDKDIVDLSKTIGRGVKKNLESKFNYIQRKLASSNLGDAMDMDAYWKTIEKQMDEIESMGLSVKGGESSPKTVSLSNANAKRHVVQLVDNDGTLRFYETDPLYATLANWQPGFGFKQSNAIAESILGFNSVTSQVFRWGTTGRDIASYINQWFRDPIGALTIGGAKPFTDLGPGDLRSFGASVATDMVPYGRKMFGKYVTANISEEMVESTFEASRKGLQDAYGEAWMKSFEQTAKEGLSGDAAEAAYKRAVVEFSSGTMGYEALPGLGGITEAQAYRAGEKVELKDVRAEAYEKALGTGESKASAKAFSRRVGKMQRGFDNFFEQTSRGNWRESFLRKSVYASQYRNAIESGATMQEAQAVATRYALDATTDFSRPFAFGNKFIKSVPYLGAAINGHKSFIRLLEIDPAGIGARMTFGLILPYMGFLTESLSDPKNREVYKEIREYEKEDSMIFVYNGAKIQIPIPQELGAFIAPFRHVVEKAANAQDASWRDLIASDVLGILPIDMSGFVGLDENQLLADDKDTGLWTRISRGVEKAASGLMPPSVKSAYMLMSGHDPYTGSDINTDKIYLDENGEAQIMDEPRSSLVAWLHNAFPQIGVTGAQKVLQNLLGRSTVSFIDGLSGVLDGGIDMKAYAESILSQASKPVDGGGDYSKARYDWNKAVNLAYDKRAQLVQNRQFQQALSILRDSGYDDDTRAGAMKLYRNKMDEYATFVKTIAQNMKDKYPEHYTQARVAQVLSLLTMPTGYNYNDTSWSRQLQQDTYYDNRAAALNTFLSMGFPEDRSVDTMLGRGYYDRYGEYQFKVYTPYEIEYLSSAKYGASNQITAMMEDALAESELKNKDRWDDYYKLSSKADKKKYKTEWNLKVVTALAPIVDRYGVDAVLSDTSTRDFLDNYLFIDNPYKTKQYLYKIFGGQQ